MSFCGPGCGFTLLNWVLGANIDELNDFRYWLLVIVRSYEIRQGDLGIFIFKLWILACLALFDKLILSAD